MQKIIIAIEDDSLRYNVKDRLINDNFEIIEINSEEEILLYAKENPVAGIVLNLSLEGISNASICQKLCFDADNIPAVVVICETNKIEIIENIFSAGASSVVTPPVKSDKIYKKIKEALGQTKIQLSKDLLPPKILSDLYLEIIDKGRKLGDVAEIVPGITTRNRSMYISEGRKSERWLPIITQYEITQYECFEHTKYVFYEPRMLLRSPKKNIINSKKILLARNAPPLLAFIDKQKRLTDLSIYNIVTVDGLLPEYVTAYLNSRIMDFFFSRIRPIKNSPQIGSVLRKIDIESIPIIIPQQSIQDKFADIVSEIDKNNQTYRSKAKHGKYRAEIHKLLFEIYGFDKTTIDKLSSLNF